MKALKVIGIIVGILLALILIIPLFLPNPAEVSAETEIALEPGQIFPVVASYSNRTLWDPWLLTDSTAEAKIEPKAGYVGSTYSWEGDMLGTGKMEVISVVENTHILSSLWFGEVPDPAVVEWHFEAVKGGTKVTWSFSQDAAYPFGRLGMIFGKMFLSQSFQSGLAKLKEVMESAPPRPSSALAEVEVGVQEAFSAMVVKTSGKMSDISTILSDSYTKVFAEVGKQGLQPAGPPFADYLEYDTEKGTVTIVAGTSVAEAGKKSGEVVPVVYNEMKVLKGKHTGPYEKLSESFMKMEKYAADNGLETTGEAFEFYLTDPGDEPDPAKWVTGIAYVLK